MTWRSQPARALGSWTSNPATRAKSRRFLVTSASSCRSAVAAMSASGVVIRDARRIRPACSATALSTAIAVNELSAMRTRSSFTCSPAKSSQSVTTEYAIGSLPTTSLRAPRKLSTRTSVSSSRPGTVPLLSRGDFQVWHRSEGAVEDGLDIAWRRPIEIRIESVPNDRRERCAFALDTRVDLSPLVLGEIHLRSGRAHIHQSIHHGRGVVAYLLFRQGLA